MTKDQLPQLKDPLPMPTVKATKGASKIEQTRRTMYGALASLKERPRSKILMSLLEEGLEAHLEELRTVRSGHVDKLDREAQRLLRECLDKDQQLKEMRQERDDCQERMRAVDEAYRKSQEALKVAGEELRECQTNLRHWREEAGKLDARIRAFESGEVHKKYLTDRQDLMAAEKLCDDQSDKLRAGERVIAEQERLIAGQRKAIADMHNELAHRRVIGKAFMQARLAFVALDEALHEAPQSKAVRAVGDEKERAGQTARERV